VKAQLGFDSFASDWRIADLHTRMPSPHNLPVVAAIDVGTNAVRLEIAQSLASGTRKTLYQERDAIRPGEGVFRTGRISPKVTERLVATMRRYAALCRRYHARTRAVATSALRDAKNRADVVSAVHAAAGLKLEVISGPEEARLICAGVLEGRASHQPALCIDIGGGSTEVISGLGERPRNLWSLALGTVRVTELFELHGRTAPRQLKLVRAYAAETLAQSLPSEVPGHVEVALGSSGAIKALVAFASRGRKQASLRELTRAVDALAAMSSAERGKHIDPSRADVIVGGGAVLEAVMRHLQLDAVRSVDAGLRQGVLIDLIRRQQGRGSPASLSAGALRLGRRLRFDESHAQQVRRIALVLFDELRKLHGLPESQRPLLEAAALLHDIGKSVSDSQHHKHSYYLLSHSSIPGLADREREIVARVARYHDRSPPSKEHPGMRGLSPLECRAVRKLATLLRVADSLDCSHHQTVVGLSAKTARGAVTLELSTRSAADLELWDSAHEALLFKRVFGKRLRVVAN
jgi:exopolyphosphatase / guanosine-5'-triphosphate,3'-diphosphate pyrophosphatase